MRLERLARELVFELTDVLHSLSMRVVKADVVTDDRAIHGDVHVLVEAHRENEPAVMRKVRGQIRSAAAEGHAKRGAREDQSRNPAAAASL